MLASSLGKNCILVMNNCNESNFVSVDSVLAELVNNLVQCSAFEQCFINFIVYDYDSYSCSLSTGVSRVFRCRW